MFNLTCFSFIFRTPRPPQLPLRRVLTLNKRPRSGTRSPSEDLKFPFKRDPLRSSSEPSELTTLLTDSLLSSTHFQVNPPSRPLRITTLSFSSFTRRATRKWSERLANNSTKSRLRKSTLLTLQEERRKHTLPSALIKTLLTLPTRSVLCEQELLPSNIHASKKDQWFNQSRQYRVYAWLS